MDPTSFLVGMFFGALLVVVLIIGVLFIMGR